ncbi:MAG: tetratricopeptide repeat protein [Gammaproteobacteria bacterium]
MNQSKAQRHLATGKKYLQQAKYQKAIDELSQALDIENGLSDADKATAYLMRGMAYFHLKQYQQTVDDISQMLMIKGLSKDLKAQAHHIRGNAYLVLNQFQLAVDDYNTALAIPEGLSDELKPSAHTSRGHAQTQLKQYQQALEDFSLVLGIDGLDNQLKAMTYLDRGQAVRQLEQYEKAIEDYSAALAIPEGLNNLLKAVTYLNRADTQSQCKQYQPAIDDCSAALNIPEGLNDEYKAQAYIVRGQAKAGLQQYQQAFEDYNAALAIPQGLNDAYKAQAYLGRGQTQALLKQYKQAFQDYNIALAIPQGLNYEQKAVTYLYRGDAFSMQEQYQSAVDGYSKALAIPKGLNKALKAAAHLNRGQASLRIGQYQLALADYKDALGNTNQQGLEAIFILTFCEYNALKASKRLKHTEEAQEVQEEFQSIALDCSNQISALHINNIETDGNGKEFLLSLAAETNKLLHEQCYFQPASNQNLAHYTDLHCCQQLIKREPFRMYHVRYMDDVLEGQHIWQPLNLSKPNSDNLSHTFIGSFVRSTENQSAYPRLDVPKSNDQSAHPGPDLPEVMDMWRIYGQNQDQPASGSCLLFKLSDMPENLLLNTPPLIASIQQTDSLSTNTQLILVSKLQTDSPLAAAGLPYRFFKVLYLDSAELEQPDSLLKGIIDCLKQPNYDFNQDPQVLQEVYRMLDKIRFLIKSRAYEHEHEVRLIQFNVLAENILLDEDRLPPRFYIDVPPEFAPDTIILGPRAERLEEWRTLEQKHADGSQPINIIKSQLEVRSR